MRPLRAFTLIELLVVIAIIGILSSVVLSALNTARAKGNDAAAKSNLDGTRSQAELFYDSNNNKYMSGTAGGANDLCAPNAVAANNSSVKGIYAQLSAAARANGITTIYTTLAGYPPTGDYTVAVCHAKADGSAWAAEVPLKSTPNLVYCVDSTGKATTTPQLFANGTFSCP